MTDGRAETRALDFERVLDHPPERVWRALTQPHLLGEWLMQSDFEAKVGTTFTMEAEWGSVTGTVRIVEHERRLSYSWNGPGLTSEVTWTLTPHGEGTSLRLDHTRIPAASKPAYYGARSGWPRFLNALESVLAKEAR